MPGPTLARRETVWRLDVLITRMQQVQILLTADINLQVVLVSRDPHRASSGQRDGWEGYPFALRGHALEYGRAPGAHSGSMLPDVFYQPHLPAGQLVAVLGEHAFEVLPSLPQKAWVEGRGDLGRREK